jgi:phosphinothricin acetyltransferase
MEPRIRLADPDRDAPAVAAIYAPSVTDGVASFESAPPDSAEMTRRMSGVLTWAPWLVAFEPQDGEADAGGRVAGYAYATRHSERAAYRWGVDLSVYVAAERQGRGIGRCLYDALVPIVRAQGFLQAYAGITLPNPASMALHRAIGMRPFATYEAVGWKRGTWWDVVWLHMRLAPELPAEPPEPIALPDLLATPEGRSRVQAILG